MKLNNPLSTCMHIKCKINSPVVYLKFCLDVFYVLLFLSHYRELLCERRMSFWRPQKERFVTSKARRMERQKQAAYSPRHRKVQDVKCAVEV